MCCCSDCAGWRISHRTHHGNHGHVENDESWYPMTESQYNEAVSAPAWRVAAATAAACAAHKTCGKKALLPWQPFYGNTK